MSRSRRYRIHPTHKNEFGPGEFDFKEIPSLEKLFDENPSDLEYGSFDLVLLDDNFLVKKHKKILALDLDDTILDFQKSSDLNKTILRFEYEFSRVLNQAIQTDATIVFVTARHSKKYLLRQEHDALGETAILKALEKHIFKKIGEKKQFISAIFFTHRGYKYFPLEFMSQTFIMSPSQLMLVDDYPDFLEMRLKFKASDINKSGCFTDIRQFLEFKPSEPYEIKDFSLEKIKTLPPESEEALYHPKVQPLWINLLFDLITHEKYADLMLIQNKFSHILFWQGIFAAIVKVQSASTNFLSFCEDSSFIDFMFKILDKLLEKNYTYLTLCQLEMTNTLMPSILQKYSSDGRKIKPNLKIALQLLESNNILAIRDFFRECQTFFISLQKTTWDSAQELFESYSPAKLNVLLKYSISDNYKIIQHPAVLWFCVQDPTPSNIKIFKKAVSVCSDINEPHVSLAIPLIVHLAEAYIKQPNDENNFKFIEFMIQSKKLLVVSPIAVAIERMLTETNITSKARKEVLTNLFALSVASDAVSETQLRKFKALDDGIEIFDKLSLELKISTNPLKQVYESLNTTTMKFALLGKIKRDAYIEIDNAFATLYKKYEKLFESLKQRLKDSPEKLENILLLETILANQTVSKLAESKPTNRHTLFQRPTQYDIVDAEPLQKTEGCHLM